MLLPHVRVGTILLGLGMSTGCYSGVHDLDKFGQDGGGDAGEGGEDAGEEEGGDAGDDGLGPADEMPPATTRFFRLTHVQWEATVQDLFELPEPTGLSSEFRADPFEGGFIFDNNALSLEVDQALWAGYQRAAVAVAEMVAADPALVAKLAPEAADEATRARDFVTSFGMRAFRRPLTETELEDHVALFESGRGLYEDATGFSAGVRLVLEAMLQSPHFLYRVEDSEDIAGDVIPLDSFEVASRLSFFLWNTMPDDELMAAAAADELRDAEAVRLQATRMLESPRAEAVLERFHHQLLHVDKFARVDPSPAFYPDAPADLGMLAVEEHDQFLRYTVFEQDGSWADLLTSTETFVNADLAKLYGLPGNFGEEFTRVDLDPAQRRGIFTQIGFLAANSTSAYQDPIHRGVFLAKTIACHTIDAPPDMLPPIPAPEDDETNREAITKLTEAEGSTCVACHKPLINPFGFAFENYDSTGAFRTTEPNGRTVDSSSTVLLKSGPVEVDGATDVVEAMAGDEGVHACYAKHWIEFAMARPHTDADDPLTDRLAQGSLEDLSVKELLVELAVSRPFLTRSAEEM